MLSTTAMAVFIIKPTLKIMLQLSDKLLHKVYGSMLSEKNWYTFDQTFKCLEASPNREEMESIVFTTLIWTRNARIFNYPWKPQNLDTAYATRLANVDLVCDYTPNTSDEFRQAYAAFVLPLSALPYFGVETKVLISECKEEWNEECEEYDGEWNEEYEEYDEEWNEEYDGEWNEEYEEYDGERNEECEEYDGEWNEEYE